MDTKSPMTAEPGLVISEMQFDLVIFDCDGVLIDSEVLACSVLRRQLIRHGMPIELDEIFDRYLGRAFSVVAEDFLRVLGRPIPEGFLPAMKVDLFETFEQELRLIPMVETLLTKLTLPFCLTSSSDWERIQVSLRVAELGRYFEGRTYNAEMVDHGKPAPDLFLFAARRMGFAASRALVIEDSVSGVEAGKAAGMTVWGFIGGSHYAGRDGTAMLTAAGADRIFTRMADIVIPGGKG
jgi:HAD superfamily hydrolase (TIGR01509 family)